MDLRVGDIVRLYEGAKVRVARVENITAGGELAQCSWTEQGVKRFAICPTRLLRKVREAGAQPQTR